MVMLDDGEEIVHIVRRHWFVMVLVTLGSLILIALPPALWITFSLLGVFPDALRVSELMLFFYLIFLIFIWMFYFVEWTDYYLDVWIITNKRVIDIEQKGLFRREMISLHYDRIQDVTVVMSGIIPTLMNFGKIHLQTAGTNRKIILKDAPNPEEVKKIIMREARERHTH